MSRTLTIDYTKCTGCRLCELVCSVIKTKVSNPSRARLHITKLEEKGISFPILCQQCEPAPCSTACPTNAFSRDNTLERMIINYANCIGCKMCLIACPFGAITFDPTTKKPVKCDLCDGEPLCVSFCPTKAIDYLEIDQVSLRKKRKAILRLVASSNHLSQE